MAKSLDQIRAGHAWNVIVEWQGKLGSKDLETLKTDCVKLPSMLFTNGLLATWAFLCSDNGRHRVAETMLDYLKKPDVPAQVSVSAAAYANPKAAYFGWVQDLSPEQLRTLTDELLAYSVWIKRTAEICIPD